MKEKTKKNFIKLKCHDENNLQPKQYFIPQEGKVPFGNECYFVKRHCPSSECMEFSYLQAQNLAQWPSRPGGQNERKHVEMYINTLQGKMSEEVGMYYFNEVLKFPCSNVDYDRTEKGQGDNSDLIIEIRNKPFNVQVKSALFYSNLLLLEKANINKILDVYDIFTLARISPSIKKVLKLKNITNINFKQENEKENKKEISNIIENVKWQVEITGHVNKEHIQKIVKENHLISQGYTLNKTTTMDADNYYVLAKDLINPGIRKNQKWEFYF